MPLRPRNYHDAVDYLYNLRKYGIKLGLSNIKTLMSILGDPHRSFNSIHIAGTNGKGSTATIIASILAQNGFKVGLYTSPHLVSFTERIRINNKKVSEDDVIRLTILLNSLIKDIKPTFFEFVTAMAFYYFMENDVDWAVIETGMGGRFDATNVIDPHVSIITNVGFDHMEFLGNTISDIAFEKAGIIKRGVPVVTASQHPDAVRVLTETAERLDSEIHIYDRDFKGEVLAMDEEGIRFDYQGYTNFNGLFLSLTGRHQLYNASMAIRTCEILNKHGISIPETSIIKGLRDTRIEGRLEIVSHNPFIILDGAHNPHAVERLCGTVKELFNSKRTIIVTGILKDKDIMGILEPLSRIADTMILTRPMGERSASSEELNGCLKRLEGINTIKTVITHGIADALNIAIREWDRDSIIIVTGSFYTAGEAKEILGHEAILSGLRE